ncbi:MAG: hypothetical protein U0L43_02925 [Muribaculaceae bacterium]|nr:hypothetical protein [Muribaculaceae bacterium]
MKRLRTIIITVMVCCISMVVIADKPRATQSLRSSLREMQNDTSSYDEYKQRVSENYAKQRKEMIERYLAYRDSVLKEFVAALGKDWEEETSDKPLPMPVDNSVPPEIIKDEPEVAPTPEPAPEPEKEVTPAPEPEKEVTPAPEPKKEVTPAPEPKKEVTPAPEPKKEVTPAPEPKKEPKAEPKKDVKKDKKKDSTKDKKKGSKAKPQPKAEPKPSKPRNNGSIAGVGRIKIDEVIEVPSIKARVQPKPFVPVIIPEGTTVTQKCEFDFFGSHIAIAIDDDCRFKLESNDNQGVAKAVGALSKNDKYNVVLKDCLNAREKLKLNDWAYYSMLIKLGETFFGEKCNEATLLSAYLYCMSGYQMRFAFDRSTRKLLILVACEQLVSGAPYCRYDGVKFFIFSTEANSASVELEWCTYALPKEKAMSLWMKDEPQFADDARLVKHRPYQAAQPVAYKVNKNLIDFYNTYPVPSTDGDDYSRWIYYAQTPLSANAQASVYPELRKQIAGKSTFEQLRTIMYFIEGYRYCKDDDVWGHDRAFFPDETLFYPMSDCEDHAILFSRLVRDLIGLPTALVYYPGHLAAAVCVDDDIPGDYLVTGNTKYLVCDPTIYYGGPGKTMTQMVGKPAKLILIK